MSVYFAQVGPYIKVGYSQNPERRVRRLFSSATSGPLGTPHDLPSRRLVRYIDGGRDDERRIQDALDDFRVETEWFLDEPEVRDFIAAVQPSDEYPPVRRPAGCYFTSYDETRDLSADAQEQLAAALPSMFAPMRRRRRA